MLVCSACGKKYGLVTKEYPGLCPECSDAEYIRTVIDDALGHTPTPKEPPYDR